MNPYKILNMKDRCSLVKKSYLHFYISAASLSSHWFNLFCIWFPHLPHGLLWNFLPVVKSVLSQKAFFLLFILKDSTNSEETLGFFRMAFFLHPDHVLVLLLCCLCLPLLLRVKSLFLPIASSCCRQRIDMQSPFYISANLEGSHKHLVQWFWFPINCSST